MLRKILRRPKQIGLCAGCRLPVFENDDYIEYRTGVAHEDCVVYKLAEHR